MAGKKKQQLSNKARKVQQQESNLTIRFEALYRRGTELLMAGRAAEARPLLEQANSLDDAHFQTRLNLAGAYILTKAFRLAVPLLEVLRQEEPDNAAVWQNLGAAYLGNPVLATDEQQLQAIAAFERALALDPAAPNVAYNIALIYRDRQDRLQARNWFRRAVQANPLDQDARRLLERLDESLEEEE